MTIWLITIGEPISIDQNNKPRLMRTGILAEFLVKSGHTIMWWNSDFEHGNSHRFGEDKLITINEKYSIQLLYGRGYKSPISLSRLVDHYQLSNKFKKYSSELPLPDIIVSSFPPIKLSLEAVNFANKNGIPILIDYRDMWPEIFEDRFPSLFKWMAKIGFSTMNYDVKKIFRKADGIIGITKKFLEFGLKRSQRVKNSFDNFFPHGYPQKTIESTKLNENINLWKESIPFLNKSDLIVCMFGTLTTRHTDIYTVINAARLLQLEKYSICFVICGNGDAVEDFKKNAIGLNNIYFPGRVNKDQILSLMELSDIGILPYAPRLDFNSSFPNKVIEYMSGSLPVLTCVEGFLRHSLMEKECGFFYDFQNPESLKKVLVDIVNNKELLKEAGDNAYNWYKKDFIDEVVYSNYANHIEFVAHNYSKSKQTSNQLE
jgi:glycosyltransferase involved in cell wall biosynthesis